MTPPPVDEEDEVSAPAVISIKVEDVGDIGNGSDLQISFGQVSDESLLLEYRVFVVRSTERVNFDLA